MLRIAAAAAIFAWGAAAHAGTATATMTVSATVSAACSIMATPLLFGGYDGRQLDATAEVSATCTDGTSFAIGFDTGTGTATASRMMTGAGAHVRGPLAYGIYLDRAHNAVWGSTVGVDTVAGIGDGSAQLFPVYGRIAANQTPGKGIYQDAVRVTISF